MSYLAGPEPITTHWRSVSTTAIRAKFVGPPTPVAGSVTMAPAEPLAEILENAILPRLLAAHGLMPKDRGPTRPGPVPDQFDVETLAPLAMDVEADALLDHVDALLRQGVSVDSLFVDLLAPAARHLGIMWDEDRCDFVQVAMGLWRLQEVVREISARLPPEHPPGYGHQHVLLAAMPGEQHSFGTVMVDEMFRRDGWQTDALLDATRAELIERVARDWFDVVGLTVSRDCNIDPLPRLIRALRSVSRNPRIIVMVGGRTFMQDPSLAAAVGADGTATDAIKATAVARDLVHAIVCEVRASG